MFYSDSIFWTQQKSAQKTRSKLGFAQLGLNKLGLRKKWMELINTNVEPIELDGRSKIKVRYLLTNIVKLQQKRGLEPERACSESLPPFGPFAYDLNQGTHSLLQGK